jgi:glycosyltransferase involved in cell wall biosynthesis
MRIAIDIREFRDNQLTGSGRFLKLFLDHIKEQEKDGIVLFADQFSDAARFENYYQVKREYAPFALWYDQFVLPGLIKREKADVYFSSNYKLPFFSKECKKLITLYDLSFFQGILNRGISRFAPYYSYINKAIKASTKIITVSEFSKKEIMKHFKVDERKIKVVYIGIDEQFRVLGRDKLALLQSKYGINFEYLLYVANMKPHKNIPGLIKSYNLLDKDKKDRYKLIIIAKQDENYRPLQEIVSNLGLKNNILFFDYVPDEDLALFYNFARIFVFPSFLEGFGLTPLEAMACGAPVVSSYTTSLKEVLQDNALYVDPGNCGDIADKLSLLLGDTRVSQDLKNKGLMHVKKFDCSSFSDILLKEIKSAY